MTSTELSALWENHNKVLIGGLQKQLERKELCDCTIVAEGQNLKAHKIVLASCSPYFKSLFLQSQETDIFTLPRGIKFRDLERLIEFVYYGILHFGSDTIDELIIAAEILQIRGLEGRPKTCFQDSRQIDEDGNCSSQICEEKQSEFYQEGETSSLPQMNASDELVPKKENLSQGAGSIHSDGAMPSGVNDQSTLKVLQNTVAAESVKILASNSSEDQQLTVREEKRRIIQKTTAQYTLPKCFVVLQDIMKRETCKKEKTQDNMQKDEEAKLQYNIPSLVSPSVKRKSKTNEKDVYVTNDVSSSTVNQDNIASNLPCVNPIQSSYTETNSEC